MEPASVHCDAPTSVKARWDKEHRMKQRRKATHTTDEKGGNLKLRSKAEGRFAAKSAYVLEHGYRSPLSTQNCKLDCVH